MSETYKIKAVGSKVNDWNSAYGPMKTYLIQVEGNGEPIQLNKKAESAPPAVGDEIFGDIEDSQWGQKFKSAKKPFSAAGGGYTRDDAAIKAQFAIKAAIAFTSSNEATTLDQVEEYAKDLFHMVDRVKTAPTIPNTSLRDNWNKVSGGDPGPSDSDMPDSFLVVD